MEEVESLGAAALDSQLVVAPEGMLDRVVHKTEGTQGVDKNLEGRIRTEEVEADMEPGHTDYIDRNVGQKLEEVERNFHWQEGEEALVDRSLCFQEGKEVDMAVLEGDTAGEAVGRTHWEVAPAPEAGRDHPDPKHLQEEQQEEGEEEEGSMMAGGKAAGVVRISSRQCCCPWAWGFLTLSRHGRAYFSLPVVGGRLRRHCDSVSH